MYASDPTVLEMIALLKAHGVKDIVISPGSRHYAFTRSFENDNYFTLHSVVDERSAAFFALGLIQATGQPAATMCTSGTASINYGSAVAEAYYQNLPLIVITTDRLPEYLGQMEDQMFDQRKLFDGFIRFAGQLRPITSSRDKWYFNRVINEALITAREGGGGPVHLNMPIESHTNVKFTTISLPDVRVITRHRSDESEPDWDRLSARLDGKRVLLVWGQGGRPSARVEEALSEFNRSFGSVVISDHLANVHTDQHVNNPLAFLRSAAASAGGLKPDVVVSFGGNLVFKEELKGFLGSSAFEHWRVDPRGEVSDPFRALTDVIQTRADRFLECLVAVRAGATARASYASRISRSAESVPAPATKHGELATIGALVSALPAGSALHIANSAPIRMANLHRVEESIDVFCNRGVNGIDGCMSTAIGYAAATPQLSFLVIGDLTFFYDMNSLGIRDLPRNLRVLLVNNGGGAVMHSPLPRDYTKVAGRHVSAEHSMTARGWVEAVGIEYRAADSSLESAEAIQWLVDSHHDGPRVLEVFTEKISDIAQMKEYYVSLADGDGWRARYRRGRRFLGRVLRRLGLR